MTRPAPLLRCGVGGLSLTVGAWFPWPRAGPGDPPFPAESRVPRSCPARRGGHRDPVRGEVDCFAGPAGRLAMTAPLRGVSPTLKHRAERGKPPLGGCERGNARALRGGIQPRRGFASFQRGASSPARGAGEATAAPRPTLEHRAEKGQAPFGGWDGIATRCFAPLGRTGPPLEGHPQWVFRAPRARRLAGGYLSPARCCGGVSRLAPEAEASG